jgi:maltose alpha-D-glucosyltransferase/alpha-amylase
MRQRWYAAKTETPRIARLFDAAQFDASGVTAVGWMMVLADVETESGAARYFMPLTLAWEGREEERIKQLGPTAIAKIRQQAVIGLMADAGADPQLCQSVIEAIGARLEIPTSTGRLRFAPTGAFEQLAGNDRGVWAPVRSLGTSSNSAVLLGEKLFIKWYRRIRAGENPELEMGRYLTDVARYENCVPVAGSIDHIAPDGTISTLALVQAFVPNQGDAWSATVDQLARFLEGARNHGTQAVEDSFGGFLALMETLGRRTGELHAALARQTGNAAFDPEPITADDLADWVRAVRTDAAATFGLLSSRHDSLAPELLDIAQRLFAAGPALQARLGEDVTAPVPGVKSRTHGDYHLGQVLLVRNDFVIIDFEGEPARELSERKRKHSPLRDVAGMLRSFDYARHAALRQTSHAGADLERMLPSANEWELRVREAFMAGYRGAVIANGLYSDDASFAATGPLLRMFEVEKALYELRYELNNRPDWVAVPLAGLAQLVDLKAADNR